MIREFKFFEQMILDIEALGFEISEYCKYDTVDAFDLVVSIPIELKDRYNMDDESLEYFDYRNLFKGYFTLPIYQSYLLLQKNNLINRTDAKN